MAHPNRGSIVPSSAAPIAGPSGEVQPAWLRFFNQLVAGAAPIEEVVLTGSPFSYTASQTGALVISDGTVSAITLTRRTTTIPISSSTVDMANGDIATVTYSVDPTINFVPN